MFAFPNHISRTIYIHSSILTNDGFSNLYGVDEVQKLLSSFNTSKTIKRNKAHLPRLYSHMQLQASSRSTRNLVPNAILLKPFYCVSVQLLLESKMLNEVSLKQKEKKKNSPSRKHQYKLQKKKGNKKAYICHFFITN